MADVRVTEVTPALNINYMDIGDTRIQWGNDPSVGGDVTMPVAFADLNFVVMVSIRNILGTDRLPSAGPVTTSTFKLITFNSGLNTFSNTGEDVSWVAIGRKP